MGDPILHSIPTTNMGGGFPKQGVPFGGPNNKEYIILEFCDLYWGPPVFWETTICFRLRGQGPGMRDPFWEELRDAHDENQTISWHSSKDPHVWKAHIQSLALSVGGLGFGGFWHSAKQKKHLALGIRISGPRPWLPEVARDSFRASKSTVALTSALLVGDFIYPLTNLSREKTPKTLNQSAPPRDTAQICSAHMVWLQILIASPQTHQP